MKESSTDKKPATENETLYEQFHQTISLMTKIFHHKFSEDEEHDEPPNPLLTNPYKTLEEFPTLAIELQARLLIANDSTTLQKMYLEIHTLLDLCLKLMGAEVESTQVAWNRGETGGPNLIAATQHDLQFIIDISDRSIQLLQYLNPSIVTLQPKLAAKNQALLADIEILKDTTQQLLNSFNHKSQTQTTHSKEFKYSFLTKTIPTLDDIKSPLRIKKQRTTSSTPASSSAAESKKPSRKRKEPLSDKELNWLKKLKQTREAYAKNEFKDKLQKLEGFLNRQERKLQLTNCESLSERCSRLADSLKDNLQQADTKLREDKGSNAESHLQWQQAVLNINTMRVHLRKVLASPESSALPEKSILKDNLSSLDDRHNRCIDRTTGDNAFVELLTLPPPKIFKIDADSLFIRQLQIKYLEIMKMSQFPNNNEHYDFRNIVLDSAIHLWQTANKKLKDSVSDRAALVLILLSRHLEPLIPSHILLRLKEVCLAPTQRDFKTRKVETVPTSKWDSSDSAEAVFSLNSSEKPIQPTTTLKNSHQKLNRSLFPFDKPSSLKPSPGSTTTSPQQTSTPNTSSEKSEEANTELGLLW